MIIYDAGPGHLDRYTVFPAPHSRNTARRRQYLACSDGGIAYSEWGELTQARGPHLGKLITLDDVSPATQAHIKRRLEEAP